MKTYRTRGVCAQLINLEVKDGIIEHVDFEGGCNGNLKAIGKLVKGQPAEEVIALLEGNTCGPRPTSCADQLAKALKAELAS